MKTFIFGAGASVHAGYPLASDMWRGLKRWAESAPTDKAKDAFRAAVKGMESRFDMSRSFELALTDLEEAIEAAPAGGAGLRVRERRTLPDLRSRMAGAIPSYFDSLRSRPADLYKSFAADVLEAQDAAITFNYDVALDRALAESGKWSVGDGYGFPLGLPGLPSSRCKLFKLHGSTNWHGELFRGSKGSSGFVAGSSLGERPVIGRADLEYLGYRDAVDPQWHGDCPRVESLIMLTERKRFYKETNSGREWEGFWDSLWSQAGEVLKASREVYLIGYSVPRYDDRARELLAKNIADNAHLQVCCHSDTAAVVRALKKLELAQAQAAPAATFEEWVPSF